jgi:hypothetical protein
MSSSCNESGLEIDEDIHQQRKVWRIERISWGIMALFTLAGLSGLLGHGPLSSTILNDPASGLLVRYERFERVNAQTFFHVQLASSGSSDSTARLSLGQEFLERVEVIRIEPEPAQVEAWPNHVVYVIARPDPDSPVNVLIHYTPLDFGRVEVEMGLEGYSAQTFSQFIYP